MKPLIAALAGASLAAAPMAAIAQHHGGSHGSWSGGGSRGSWSGGGSPRGAMSGAGGWQGHWSGGASGAWAGHHMDGFHHFHHDHFPVFFGGFGLGLALGAAWDPWWWDGPYYGYGWGPYPPYEVIGPPYGYGPPPPASAAPPVAAPPATATPPAAACGSWSWNAPAQRYDWIPCPS